MFRCRKSAISIIFLIVQVFCPLANGEIVIYLPDLSASVFQSENSKLTTFNPVVSERTQPLLQAFLECPKEQFWVLDDFVGQRISHSLHHDILRVALAHRTDLGGFHSESIAKPIPVYKDVNQYVLILDYPSDGADIENRISYYREDLGLNLFHMIWHLNYPMAVPIDRKGESFGYMHQQLIARYNFERFSNKVPRVKTLNLREPVVEGYTPRLFNLTDINYSPRAANMYLKDLNRPHENIVAKIEEVEKWRTELLNAIEAGVVVTSNGDRIVLDEETGPEIIWNLLEANGQSVNKDLYGRIHSALHWLTSRVHDPSFHKQMPSGLVGTHSGALRDPLFYRLHEEVDILATAFTSRLTPYTQDQLSFAGVEVKSAEVEVHRKAKRNTFYTHEQQSDVMLLEGLDFESNKTAIVRYTHTQHEPFTYRIRVQNKGGRRSGVCRVFLAPKYDENGRSFTFNDQRKFFIELDKFHVTLSTGQNIIERESLASTVTIPPEATFVDTTANGAGPDLFLGCGYPHNLLIPRGNKAGFKSQLFVMISDYEQDKVEGVDLATVGDDNALSICGLKGSKHPDKRPMGYPFDRVARQGVTATRDFLTPNMALTDVEIKFSPARP